MLTDSHHLLEVAIGRDEQPGIPGRPAVLYRQIVSFDGSAEAEAQSRRVGGTTLAESEQAKVDDELRCKNSKHPCERLHWSLNGFAVCPWYEEASVESLKETIRQQHQNNLNNRKQAIAYVDEQRPKVLHTDPYCSIPYQIAITPRRKKDIADKSRVLGH